MANFETAGIKLELQGFAEFVNSLSKIDEAQGKTAASSESLATSLSGLESIAMSFFGRINRLSINIPNLGFDKLGHEATQNSARLEGFSKSVLQTTDALQKAAAQGLNTRVFDSFANAMEDNAHIINSSFKLIESTLKKLKFDDLAEGFARLSIKFGDLVENFKKIDSAVGQRVLGFLEKLVPVFQQAKEIGNLGNVGRSIRSLVDSFKNLKDLPDLSAQRENINVILSALRRFSALSIPAGIGTQIVELSQGISSLGHAFTKIKDITLDKNKLDMIFNFINEFQRLSTAGFNTQFIKDLAESLLMLSRAFRNFFSGKIGQQFTVQFSIISQTIQEFLQELERLNNMPNNAQFLQFVKDLAGALKILSQGFRAFTKDFQNQGANFPTAVASIIRAIADLDQVFNSFGANLPKFLNTLKIVGDAMKEFAKVFVSIGRSTVLGANLKDAIDTIINSLLELKKVDFGNIVYDLNKITPALLAFNAAMRLVSKTKIDTSFINNLTELNAARFAWIDVLANAFIRLFKVFSTSFFTGIVGLAKALLQVGKAVASFTVDTIIFGLKSLGKIIQTLAAPIIGLINLIKTLSNAFSGLFSGGKSKTASMDLGLDKTSAQVKQFKFEIEGLHQTMMKTGSSALPAELREVGNAADAAGQDVTQLDNKLDQLENRRGFMGFNKDFLGMATTFKAVDIAADAVTDTIYGAIYGIGDIIRQAVSATAEFEQLEIQLTALQARELVNADVFASVPEALSTGADLISENVDGLINQFRLLAIQSPFEMIDVSQSFKVAQAFGFTTDEAKELVTTLIDAGSALGFTGDDLKEVARVFGQIRAAGKLAAQDINQLADRGIAVRPIFTAMGYSADDLSKGVVTADFAIRALLNTLQNDFQGAAIRSADTLDGLFGAFASFRAESLRTFVQPIIEGLKPLFLATSDLLFSPDFAKTFMSAGELAGQSLKDGMDATLSGALDATQDFSVFALIQKQGEAIRDTILDIIVGIGSVAGVITSIFEAIPTPIVNLIGVLGKAVGVALLASTAFVALAFAVGLVSAAFTFAFVGNPIGILAAILSVVISLLGPLNQLGTTLTTLGQIIQGTFSGTYVLPLVQQLPQSVQELGRGIVVLGNQFKDFIGILQQVGELSSIAFSLGGTSTIQEEIRSLTEVFQITEMVVEIAAVFGQVNEVMQNFGTIIGETVVGNLATATQAITMLPTALQGVGISLMTFIINIQTAFAALPNAIIGAVSSIASAINGIMASIVNSIASASVGIQSAIFSMAGSITNIVSGLYGIAGGIASFLNGLVSTVASYGAAVVSAFADGMISAVNLVISAVNAIAQAISYLLAPGSPPRAIPEIDTWGKEAANQFLMGFGEINKSDLVLDDLAKRIKYTVDNMGIDRAQEMFPNLVDEYGNIINLQYELINATDLYANSLANVEKEIANLDAAINLDQQQGLINSLIKTLQDPRLSEQGRASTEQQLYRARLELLRQQLALSEQEEATNKSTSQAQKDAKKNESSGDGGSGGKGGGAEKEEKEPKGKGGGGGGSGEVPEVNKLNDVAGGGAGGGLLGRLKDAFENARTGIVESVTNLKDSVLNVLNTLATQLSKVYGYIGRLTAEFGKVMMTSFDGMENGGLIFAGLGGLAGLIGGTLGWNTLFTIAAGVTALGAAWAIASGNISADMVTDIEALNTAIKEIQTSFALNKAFEETGLSNKSLIESIIGFNPETWTADLGAIFAKLDTLVTQMFKQLDMSITNAITANESGENPFTKFFSSMFEGLLGDTKLADLISREINGVVTLLNDTFNLEIKKVGTDVGKTSGTSESSGLSDFIKNSFSVEGIQTTITTEIGKLINFISTTLNTEMNKLFAPSIGAEQLVAMSVGGDSFSGVDIFIKNLLTDIQTSIQNFDLSQTLADLEQTISQGITDLFTNISNFDFISDDGWFSGMSDSFPFLTPLKNFLAEVKEITFDPERISTVLTDIGRIRDQIMNLFSFGAGGGGGKMPISQPGSPKPMGVSGSGNDSDFLGLGTIAIFTAAIGALSIALAGVSGSLGVMATTIELVNNLSQTIQSLFDAIGKFSIGQSTSGIEALKETGTQLSEALASFTGISTGTLSIINDTTDSITRLFAALAGVENPQEFQQKAVAIGIALDAVAGILLGGALVKLAQKGPDIVKAISAIDNTNKMLILLTTTATVLNGLELPSDMPNADNINSIIDTVSTVLNGLLLLDVLVKTFTGGKKTVIPKGLGLLAYIVIFEQIDEIIGALTSLPYLNQADADAVESITTATKVMVALEGLAFALTGKSFITVLGKGINLVNLGKIGTFIKTLIGGIGTITGGTLTGVSVGTIATISATIIGIIGAVAGMFEAFNENIGGIKDISINIIEKFINSVRTIFDGINQIFSTVSTANGTNVSLVSTQFEGIKTVFDGLGGVFESINDFTATFTSPEGAVNNALNAVQGIISLIDKLLGTDLETGAAANFFDPIREFFESIPLLGDAINTVGIGLPGAGAGILISNIEGLFDSFAKLAEFDIVGIFNDTIGKLEGLVTNLAGLNAGSDASSGINSIVFSLFSLIDVLQSLANLNIQDGVLIILELIRAISNPGQIGDVISNVGEILKKQNEEIREGIDGLDSLADQYLEDLEKFNNAGVETVTPTLNILPDVTVDEQFLTTVPEFLKKGIEGVSVNREVRPNISVIPDVTVDEQFLTTVPEIFRKELENQVTILNPKLRVQPEVEVVEQSNNIFKRGADALKSFFGIGDDSIPQQRQPLKIEVDPEITNVSEARENVVAQTTELTTLTGDTQIVYSFGVQPKLTNKEEIPNLVAEQTNESLDNIKTKESVIRPKFKLQPIIQSTDLLASIKIDQIAQTLESALSGALQAIINFVTQGEAQMTQFGEAVLASQTETSEGIVETNVTMSENVITTITTMVSAVIAQFNVMSSTAISIANAMRAGVVAAVSAMRSQVISIVQSMVSELISIMASGAASAVSAFVSAFSSLPGQVQGILSQMLSIVGASLARLNELGRQGGVNFANGLIDGMLSRLDAIRSVAGQLGQAMNAGVSSATRSSSPSKTAIEEANNFVDGLLIGTNNGINTIFSAGQTLGEALQAGVSSVLSAPILTPNFEQGITNILGPQFDPNIKVEENPTKGGGGQIQDDATAIQKEIKEATRLFEQVGKSFSNAFNAIFEGFKKENPEFIGSVFNTEGFKSSATTAAKAFADTIQEISEILTPAGKQKFAELIRGVFESPENLAIIAQDIAKALGPDFVDKLPELQAAFNLFKNALDDGFDGAAFIADGEFEYLENIILGGFGSLGNIIKQQSDKIKQEAKKIETGVKRDPFLEALFGDPNKQAAKTAVEDTVKVAADSAFVSSSRIGENISSGIVTGLTSNQSLNALRAAADSIFSVFMQQLRRTGEIRSPSRVAMKKGGVPIYQGVEKGIEKGIPEIKKTTARLTSIAMSSFNKTRNISSEIFNDKFVDQNVGLNYNGLLTSLPSLTQNVLFNSKKPLNTLPLSIKNIGENFKLNRSNSNYSFESNRSNEARPSINKKLINSISSISQLTSINRKLTNSEVRSIITNSKNTALSGRTEGIVSSNFSNSTSSKFFERINSQLSNSLQNNKVSNDILNVKQNELISNYAVQQAEQIRKHYEQIGNNQAIRTTQLTNHSNLNETNMVNQEYHQHLTVTPNRLTDARRNFRVLNQLGIRK